MFYIRSYDLVRRGGDSDGNECERCCFTLQIYIPQRTHGPTKPSGAVGRAGPEPELQDTHTESSDSVKFK